MSRPPSDSFDYTLFGLHIVSEIPLPELPPALPDTAPDISIRYGAMKGGANGRVEPIDGGAMLAIDGVARYAILGGDRILVEPAPGVAERNVRLFLLGSAMGMLLHQRGLLPLHANAVEIDGKAFAFMGPSGAGKSTLAAWFHDRGHRVIADDVCVVRFDDKGQPIVFPGLPRLRLWKSAIDATGRDSSHYERSFSGGDNREKYDVPLDTKTRSGEAIPLAAAYFLGRNKAGGISPLTGVTAADAVFANTYRGQYVAMAQADRVHWTACMTLITRTPIFRADRRWDLAALDEQCQNILDHARQVGAEN